MNLGDRMLLLRKEKGLSQAALGKLVGTSGDIIGRYERGVMTPSVDAIVKIADSLEVSLDYLVGKTNLEINKEALTRLEELTSLPSDKRRYIFDLVDILIRDFKTQKAYS